MWDIINSVRIHDVYFMFKNNTRTETWYLIFCVWICLKILYIISYLTQVEEDVHYAENVSMHRHKFYVTLYIYNSLKYDKVC